MGSPLASSTPYLHPTALMQPAPSVQVLCLVLKGWRLSPQLEEIFRYARAKGPETGLPPTWPNPPPPAHSLTWVCTFPLDPVSSRCFQLVYQSQSTPI